jgi:hypothetical protein
MTMAELETTLPNGLHDSIVSRIAVDYAQKKLTLDLAVWIGDLDTSDQVHREKYRRGRIVISGLIFAVIEPPDPRYPFSKATELTIDGCDMSKNLSSELTQSLPPEAFVRSLWVNEWNAFIHIAARNAELAWIDDSGARS